MNKKLSFVTAAFLSLSSLCAQTVNLQPGWNLIGTGGMKLDLQNTFASYTDVKYVWAFENQNKSWLVYGNTQDSKANISNSSYSSNQTNYLDTYSGLWVLNDSNYIKSINLVETTNIPQQYDYELNYDFVALELNDVANKSFYSSNYHLEDSIDFDSTGYAKFDYSNYAQYSDEYEFNEGVLKYTEYYNSSDLNTTDMHEVNLKALAKNENGIVLTKKPDAEPNYYEYEGYTKALISTSATKDTFNPTLPYTLYKSWGGYIKLNSDGSLEFDYEGNNRDSTYSNGVISGTDTYSSYEDETFDETGGYHYGYKEDSSLTFMYKIGDFWLAEISIDAENWDASVGYDGQEIDFATHDTWDKFFTATNNTLWGMKLENGKIYREIWDETTGEYDSYEVEENSSYTISNNILDLCHEDGTYCQKYEIKDGKMYTYYSGTYMEVFSEKPLFNYIGTTNSGY
ncbi:MAG: hypothetical protein ACQERD_07015 [Campylobacterota bacterium]